MVACCRPLLVMHNHGKPLPVGMPTCNATSPSPSLNVPLCFGMPTNAARHPATMRLTCSVPRWTCPEQRLEHRQAPTEEAATQRFDAGGVGKHGCVG